MDIAPANNDLGEAEMVLTKQAFREQILRTKLANLEGYDYTVIDTPPSLGNLTMNAIIASDTIIVPIQTQFFAVEGLSTINRPSRCYCGDGLQAEASVSSDDAQQIKSYQQTHS